MSSVKILVFVQLLSLSTVLPLLQLNDQTFHLELEATNHLLVFFVASNCSYCHKIRPQLFNAAIDLQSTGVEATLAELNCSKGGQQICSKQNVSSVPQLQYFHQGTYIKDYNEGIDSQSVYAFVRGQVYPESAEITSIEEFRRFLPAQRGVVVAGFFEEDSSLKKLFFKLHSDKKEKATFLHSSNERLLRREGVYNGVVLFKPAHLQNRYEEDRVLFTGNPVIGELTNFMTSNFHGLVGFCTPSNQFEFEIPSLVLYYNIDPRNKGIEASYWRLRLLKIASKYKNQVTFAVAFKDDFPEDLGEVGLMPPYDHKPVVIATDLEKRMFLMYEEFSGDALEHFVDKFVEGRLSVIARLHAGDEFQTISSTEDTLMMLCSPGCKRCKDFVPVLEDVAVHLYGEEVAVVRVETNKGVPKYYRDKMSNIFFMHGKNKAPVMFGGDWSFENVIRFVALHARKELRKFDRFGNERIVKTEL